MHLLAALFSRCSWAWQCSPKIQLWNGTAKRCAACVSCVCGYVLQVLHLFVYFSPRSYWHFALGRNSNLRLYSRSGKEKYSINHGIKNAQAKLTQACVTEYSCGCLEIARFCRRTLEHVRQKLPEDAEEAFASCELGSTSSNHSR